MFSYGSAMAWGFGDLRVNSALGQAFRAQLTLLGSDSTSIERHCFSASLTSYDGVQLGRVILDIKEGASDINFSGVPPVNEPAAKLILTHTCKPKMQREYAILLDPPIGNLPAVAAAPREKQSQAAPGLNNLPAPSAGTSESDAKPKKTSRRAARPQTADIQTDIAPQATQATQEPVREKKRKKEKKAVDAPVANVLRLGGGDNIAADLPGGGDGLRLSMSYGLSGLIPAPAPVPATSAAAPAAGEIAVLPIAAPPVDTSGAAFTELMEKIRVLEGKTEELRKLNTKQLIDLDNAKKEQAPKSSLLILYLLLFACVIGIAWLVWRMRQLRSEGAGSSWQEMVPDTDNEPYDPHPEQRHIFDPVVPDNVIVKPGEAANEEKGSELKKVAEAAHADSHHDYDANFYSGERLKIVAAEELSDELQESEFWVHINQPLRAIEILEAKSNEDKPSSPLPWLNLFDLYRMVGDREKYEALEKRFTNIYNGRILPWDEVESSERPRSLEDFPIVMGRIVQLWPTDALLPFMENLLIDEREGNREGFDLAAFREILFLTNIAHKIQLSKKLEKAPSVFPNWSIL